MTSLSSYLVFVFIISFNPGLPCYASSIHPSNSSSEASPLAFPAAGQHHQCPTWFFWNKTTHQCQCGPSSNGAVCYQTKNHTLLRWMFCMTYDSATESTMAGMCPFGSLQPKHHSHVHLPENRSQLNDIMCGKSNREGLLCSRCKPSYGPAVLLYNHKCAKCSGSYLGWFLYFCVALIPTTVFFLIIVLCQVRTTSAPMNLFVLACQTVSMTIAMHPNEVVYHSELTKYCSGIVVTVLTSWNLDFFRLIIPPFCVSENLSNLQVLCMDYIVAFYPLLLTLAMYICIQQHARGCRLLVCLWMPFGYCLSPLMRRLNWNPVNSIVPIFASFLLLSSTKILFVSLSLLRMGSFANLSDDGEMVRHDSVLYYDPTFNFLSQSHIPYAILAVLVVTTFVIFPALLLTMYPTRHFQKVLNCCGLSCHAVHAFADAFNGCYKNGANGTRDYRCFAGFYLFARILGIITVTFMRKWCDPFSLLKGLLISYLFIFTLASPYRSRLFNIVDSFGITLVAIRLCLSKYRDIFNVVGLVYIALYFVVLICCKIILILNCHCSRKLKALVEQMSGVSEMLPPIEREAGDEEANLPDRLVNPDGYRGRVLYKEPQCLSEGSSTLTHYGSIQRGACRN